MSRDEWRYIIPRPFLDGLAATRALGRSSQVLVALICKMYGDQENAGSETPTATVTLASLVKMTGRGTREVQKSITILYRAGVLIDVDAQPGRAKVLRLNPGPNEPTPETGQGRQSGRGSGAKSGVGPVPNRARVPTPEMGHTHKEQRRDLLKEPFERTLDVADVDRAHSSNGHGSTQAVAEAIDIGRLTRIRALMYVVLYDCPHFRGKAGDRWQSHVEQLIPDLARTELREVTVGQRARKYFAREYWCHLGDSKQASQLRRHMLQPVQKRKKAASR